MENVETKTEVLKMARQFRQSPVYSNIYITPDLTWREREEGRRLREELARRRESGEENLAIRRGKIVHLSSDGVLSESSRSHSEGGHSSTTTSVPAPCTVHAEEAGFRSDHSTGASGPEPETSVTGTPEQTSATVTPRTHTAGAAEHQSTNSVTAWEDSK